MCKYLEESPWRDLSVEDVAGAILAFWFALVFLSGTGVL